MEKQKPPITKYPGNVWLADQLDKHGAVATVPFIHGVVRGAVANPFPMDQAMAMAEAFDGISPSTLPKEEVECLTLAFMHLWNETGRCFEYANPLPEVIASDIRTPEDEESVLQACVDLAEGFETGFSLRKPPKGERLERTRTWLRDIAKEKRWCLEQLKDREKFNEGYPEARDRALAIKNALAWLEECMGWAAIYAGMDVYGKKDGLKKVGVQ
jgi:hypothetical protein